MGGLAKGAVCLEWSGGRRFSVSHLCSLFGVVRIERGNKVEQRQRLSEWRKKECFKCDYCEYQLQAQLEDQMVT